MLDNKIWCNVFSFFIWVLQFDTRHRSTGISFCCGLGGNYNPIRSCILQDDCSFSTHTWWVPWPHCHHVAGASPPCSCRSNGWDPAWPKQGPPQTWKLRFRSSFADVLPSNKSKIVKHGKLRWATVQFLTQVKLPEPFFILRLPQCTHKKSSNCGPTFGMTKGQLIVSLGRRLVLSCPFVAHKRHYARALLHATVCLVGRRIHRQKALQILAWKPQIYHLSTCQHMVTSGFEMCACDVQPHSQLAGSPSPVQLQVAIMFSQAACFNGRWSKQKPEVPRSSTISFISFFVSTSSRSTIQLLS